MTLIDGTSSPYQPRLYLIQMAAFSRVFTLSRMLIVLLVVHLEMKCAHGLWDHLNALNYRRHLGVGGGATYSLPAFTSSNTSIFNGAFIRWIGPYCSVVLSTRGVAYNVVLISICCTFKFYISISFHFQLCPYWSIGTCRVLTLLLQFSTVAMDSYFHVVCVCVCVCVCGSLCA